MHWYASIKKAQEDDPQMQWLEHVNSALEGHYEANLIRLRKQFIKERVLRKQRANGTAVMLTVSSKPGVKFQLTRFSADGKPFGDTEYTDLNMAIKEYAQESGIDRSDFPDDLAFRNMGSTKFIYRPKMRPVSPGAVPKQGLIETRAEGEYGLAVYDRPLSESEIQQYELEPVGYEDVA